MMHKLTLPLVVGSLLSLTTAHAQLTNRYSFNDGTGNDSVGGANGTVQGAATVANGLLTTVQANGSSGDYLRLSSGPAPAAGITGDFSLEFYASQAGAQNGATSVFSLSNAQTSFLLFKPNNNGTGPTINLRTPGINGGNEIVAHTSANSASSIFNNGSFGAQYQIIITYAAATGAFTLYRNGAQYGTLNYQSGTITGAATTAPVGFNLSSITSGGLFNGLNGGDAFTDPNFNGSTDDFRIYANALSAAQVTSLYNAGPNAANAFINATAVPEPSTSLALVAGVGALLGVRRLRRPAV